MGVPKAGYKGAVYLDTTKIGGATTWAYDGETRNMQDVDEFEDQHIMSLPLQIVGGNVTITGNCLMGDAGQVLLESRLADGAQIADLKLYLDKVANTYFTLDPAVTMTADSIPSHAIVTTAKVIGDDKSGVATFSATLKINGALKRVG